MEFLPILGVYKTWAATVHGSRRCLILLFMMRHTFSIGDRSGLQGQKHTASMPTKPTHCRMRPGFVLLNRQKSSSWQHMSLQNSNISLRINGTFTNMQITHAVGTDAPPYHHRGRFLHFSSGWSFSSLARRIHVRFSQKQAEMRTRLTSDDDFGPRELVSCTKLINAFLFA